jgi:hypothetical protein
MWIFPYLYLIRHYLNRRLSIPSIRCSELRVSNEAAQDPASHKNELAIASSLFFIVDLEEEGVLILPIPMKRAA